MQSIPSNTPKRKKSAALSLPRVMKLLLLLIFIAVMKMKQDIATSSKYAPNNDNAVGSNYSLQKEHTYLEAGYRSRGLLGSGRTNASQYILPSLEWFDDIDTNSSVLGCGFYKCAFHSRTSRRDSSNNPDRDRYGYIVQNTIAQSGKKIGLDTEDGTFALAQELSETFSIRHTLLANPITVTTNQTFRGHKTKKRGSVVEEMVRAPGVIESGSIVFVQPIELYPKDSILFKCKTDLFFKAMRSVQALKSFSAIDPRAFEERLRSDLNKTIVMMDSERARCLSEDFQVVIDASTGSIIHIDMDRVLTTQVGHYNYWNEACMQKLENITEYMTAKKYVYMIKNARDHEDYDDVEERISTYTETVKMFNKYNYDPPSKPRKQKNMGSSRKPNTKNKV